MNAPPLTHHDMLALAAPFARSGRHVDLAASDRIARRIAFRAADAADTIGALREELHLDDLGTGTLRLVRTLVHPSGLRATLEAMGPQPEALLQRIDAIPPPSQFSAGDGFVIARSLVVTDGALRLARGVVRLQGIELVMTLSPVRGVAAELQIEETGGERLALPDDLLAVLGWDWTRLVRQPHGWKSRLRLRGGPERRTRHAEAALARAAEHLARTLAEPPARFHERHLRARLGAMCRRGIPLATPAALAITVLAMPRVDIEGNPLWRLLYHLPTVLIAGAFLLQELPAFEIPRWPRPRRSASWSISPDGPDGPARR